LKQEIVKFETRKSLIILYFIRVCQKDNTYNIYNNNNNKKMLLLLWQENKEKEMKKSKSDFTNEISIKNNNEIVLPKIIKSEVNLLLFPFFTLERKDKRSKTEYRDIDKRGDQKKEIIWNVSANPEYGYPGPFDREVHKVIDQIATEYINRDGIIKNPIQISIYNLYKRMGIKGGGNYQ